MYVWYVCVRCMYMVYMVVVGMIMVVLLMVFSLISGTGAPPAAFGGADLNSLLPPGGTTFLMESY